MRFLKNKILLSQQIRTRKQSEHSTSASDLISNHDDHFYDSLKEGVKSFDTNSYLNCPGSPKTPEKIRCTKNIVKNYGRAIAKFACSEMALPYMLPILKEKGVEYSDALSFFSKAKTKIQGIDTFRALVLVLPTDTAKEAALKEAFQAIGEVFIKYFSVNWIFHSKILHRTTYLRYRFKMLRRLQNPIMFTYLKG